MQHDKPRVCALISSLQVQLTITTNNPHELEERKRIKRESSSRSTSGCTFKTTSTNSSRINDSTQERNQRQLTMTKYQRVHTQVILLLVATVAASRSTEASRRFNLLEPVFADDDLTDAHTVTAGAHSSRATQAGEFGRRHGPSSAPQRSAPSRDQELPPRVDDLARQQLPPSATPTFAPLSTTKAELLKKLQQQRQTSTGNELKRSSINVRRQIESHTNPQNAATSLSSSSTTTTIVRKRQTTEPPRHWSALENYYEKLRHSLVDKTNRGKPLTSDESLAFDQIVQEGLGQDPIYRYQPIYRGDPSGGGGGGGGAVAYPPSSSSGKQFQSVISSQVAQPQAPFLFPQVEPNYNQQPAYISANPNSGIGSKSLLMSNFGPLSQPQQESLSPVKSIIQQTPVTIETHPSQQLYQPVVHEQHRQQLPVQIISWSPASPPAAGQDNFYLRKLNDYLQVQQQARAKHQQDSYGNLYDARRALELQQEETICGLSAMSPQALPAEFPSHMGVYNGTRMSDEEFLCGAVWVHERFALTLASCLKSLPANASLNVRTGEWNLRSNLTEAQRASLVSRRVLRLHVFPRFQANSSEHNLALLEWLDPVALSVDNPFMAPACLARSRTSLRATNCWAPVRNTTFVEYFDAEGEGETKLRREVKMVRVPVFLFGNEEAQCQKQTGVEYFNFKNPNYICSADSRPKGSWRSTLNNADYFGSGIYCNENGYLNLVSIVHPMVQGSPSIYGNLDLTYYQIWIRKVIFGGEGY